MATLTTIDEYKARAADLSRRVNDLVRDNEAANRQAKKGQRAVEEAEAQKERIEQLETDLRARDARIGSLEAQLKSCQDTSATYEAAFAKLQAIKDALA